jgi:hypothetical protein
MIARMGKSAVAYKRSLDSVALGTADEWPLVCTFHCRPTMLNNNDQPTVLIAEDQEHVREALAMLLRAHDYPVLTCDSPQEALRLASQQLPDLALVDMNYRRDSTSGVEGLNLSRPCASWMPHSPSSRSPRGATSILRFTP